MARLARLLGFGTDTIGTEFLDDNPSRAIGRESLTFTEPFLGE